MRLVELTEYYDYTSRKGEYSRWLKDQGYKIPEKVKGKGFILVSYEDEEKVTKKSYSNLDDAEGNTPVQRGKHWQIYNGSTGEVEKEPLWWYVDQQYFQTHRGSY